MGDLQRTQETKGCGRLCSFCCSSSEPASRGSMGALATTSAKEAYESMPRAATAIAAKAVMPNCKTRRYAQMSLLILGGLPWTPFLQ